MIVLVLEDAAADLEAGRRFYDVQEPGVGDYFVESLLSDLESLVIFARIHPRHFGFYRMLAKRFPFAVYYELVGDMVHVYAVLDMRRDPLWIRTELRDRA